MNTIVKSALLVFGGGTLFVGSFVGVALISGRPAHEIPVLKNFAHKPEPTKDPHGETAHVEPPEPEIPAAKQEDPQGSKQASPAVAQAPTAASVLGAFVMPAPFNGDELARMQSKLAIRLEEAEVAMAAAKEKQRAVDERERALLGREKELQSLKLELDTRSKELKMREMELNRDLDAGAAREEKSWAELARFFQDGEPEELAQKLITFEPANAAKILRQMDDERAIALVNALPQDQYKTFLDAYRKSVK
ncbi:MAG: hypothetical protein JNL28_09270 [Planctomycetes bacterium]|nr:hypothetical protein [Planctomycetota bacterium]